METRCLLEFYFGKSTERFGRSRVSVKFEVQESLLQVPAIQLVLVLCVGSAVSCSRTKANMRRNGPAQIHGHEGMSRESYWPVVHILPE